MKVVISPIPLCLIIVLVYIGGALIGRFCTIEIAEPMVFLIAALIMLIFVFKK